MSQPTVVYGASFTTPLMEHLEAYDQPCMEPFTGTVSVNCTDGNLIIQPSCQQGCFKGNRTIEGGAMVFFPDMVSGATHQATCPQEYAGAPLLQCVDGTPEVIEGSCKAHCKAG